MPYLAEKLEEKDGESNAPSDGGARRMVVMVGGTRREDSNRSSRWLLMKAGN